MPAQRRAVVVAVSRASFRLPNSNYDRLLYSTYAQYLILDLLTLGKYFNSSMNTQVPSRSNHLRFACLCPDANQ